MSDNNDEGGQEPIPLAQPRKNPVWSKPEHQWPPFYILEGWRIERINRPPFEQILFITPQGYSTVVASHERNPENILYLLGDALLKEAGL